MNDEIKREAEIYAYRECCETEYNSRTDDLENGFIDGANYATEKCQEEIKRLKDCLDDLYEASVMYWSESREYGEPNNIKEMALRARELIGIKELQND